MGSVRAVSQGIKERITIIPSCCSFFKTRSSGFDLRFLVSGVLVWTTFSVTKSDDRHILRVILGEQGADFFERLRESGDLACDSMPIFEESRGEWRRERFAIASESTCYDLYQRLVSSDGFYHKGLHRTSVEYVMRNVTDLSAEEVVALVLGLPDLIGKHLDALSTGAA